MKKIGARIRASRLRVGISLCELARRIGSHPNYVHRIEHDMHWPNEDRLKAICAEVDLDFYMLMCRSGRLPSDVTQYIARTPGVIERIRREMAAA